MDLGNITSKGLLEEQEDNEDEKLSYGRAREANHSDEKIQRAKRRKAEHVYESFVRPSIEDLGEEFSEEDVLEAVRPPYSQDEIDQALEYGIEEGDLEYLEDNGSYSSRSNTLRQV